MLDGKLEMTTLLKKLKKFFCRKHKQNSFIVPEGMILGTNVLVTGTPRILISENARIFIGNNVTLNSNPLGYHAAMGFPVTLSADQPDAEIHIGDNSRLHGCCIHAKNKIFLGRNCLIAAGVQIMDAQGHATEFELSRLRTKIKDIPGFIEIGNYVWIGLNSIILKNVTIGECSVVAANSVVTSGTYPPFSLIGGNPAKVIKTYNPDTIYPEDMPLEIIGIDESRMFKS